MADPAQLGRQSAQSINDSIPFGPLCNGVLTESQGHHGDDHHLACIGLCGSNTNLTASIDVDAAVCMPCNGAANSVGDANA